MKTVTSINEYIKLYPKDVQVKLNKLRKFIKKLAPDATEAISYGIPTFKLNGNLIHFGGYDNFISIYPGSQAIKVFEKELNMYKTSKGTIQFPNNKPIPYDLIEKIVKFRIRQNK